MSDVNWYEVTRALRSLRRMQEPRVCQVCGKEFVGASYSKYCGKACQQAAYWDRHREELNQKRREKYRRQKGANASSAAEGRQPRQEGQQTAPTGQPVENH